MSQDSKPTTTISCPTCGGATEPRAIVDSWDRIYDRYRVCRECGWDSRTLRAEIVP